MNISDHAILRTLEFHHHPHRSRLSLKIGA